jgi:hypothetical protein
VTCIVAFLLGRALAEREYVLPGFGETVAVEAPVGDGGFAYAADLGRPDWGVEPERRNFMLYEIRTVQGAALFEDLDRRLGWSTAYQGLRALLLLRFPEMGVEKRRVLGPGRQTRATIRTQAGGRYAVANGTLYFSASDNTSPASNARRYEILQPGTARKVVKGFSLALQSGALLLIAATCAATLAQRPRVARFVSAIGPGVLNSVLAIAILAGLFEAYQRLSGRFAGTAWPFHVDPVAGFLFEPRAEVRWTNHLDFWAREETNSLGYLDREPLLPKPPGRRRILVVGDSFVEAAQVRNADKVQAVLEGALRRRLGEDAVDATAFGYSGTGQANQLGFYAKDGRAVAPDLVVLLLVANDFANNSPILEAIRNGWHPYRPPRPFFERDGAGFRPVPVDPDWMDALLAGSTPADRYAALAADAEFAPRLAGWGGPAAVDMDEMFWRRTLPPLFEDALALTAHAIWEWVALGRRDGFALVLVATDTMTNGGADDVRHGALQIERFRAIADAAGVPFLDLYPAFVAHGTPDDAHWRYDGHWNETGHRWAGEATAAFIEEQRLLDAKQPAADGESSRR